VGLHHGWDKDSCLLGWFIAYCDVEGSHIFIGMEVSREYGGAAFSLPGRAAAHASSFLFVIWLSMSSHHMAVRGSLCAKPECPLNHSPCHALSLCGGGRSLSWLFADSTGCVIIVDGAKHCRSCQ